MVFALTFLGVILLQETASIIVHSLDVFIVNAFLKGVLVIITIQLDHVLKEPCLKDIARLSGLVNQLHHVVNEVGIVPSRLLVQLLHLLADFLLLLFVVFHLLLALAEDLVDLSAALLCSFDLIRLIFFNCL